MDNKKFRDLMVRLFNEDLLIEVGKELSKRDDNDVVEQGTWSVDTVMVIIGQHLTTPNGWAKFMMVLRKELELDDDYEGRYYLGRVVEKIGKEI